MKEKLISWMNQRRYNSHLMRLLVGGYVVYLGCKIFKSFADSGVVSIPQAICAGLLILLGLPVAAVSLYAVYHGYSVEYQGNTDFRKKKSEDNEDDNLS